MTRGTALVLLAALVVAGVPALVPPEYPLDEYLPLVAAQRVLAGEVPYRDYTTLYPPLTTLLCVPLVLVAPGSLVLPRLLFVALAVLGVWLVKKIVELLGVEERSATLVGLLTALSHGAPHWGYALVPATVLVLGAAACALKEGRPWTIAAGALLGLASLARHDVAFWAAIPLACVVGARSRRELLLLLGVAALPALALLSVLAPLGALPHAWEQLVVIPATLYPRIRGLPLPRPWKGPGDAENLPALFSIYGPFIVSALAFARSRADARRRAVAALPFFLGLSALVRPDRAHLYAASLASFAALGLLVEGRRACLAVALALTLPVAGRELYETARAAKRVVTKRAPLVLPDRERVLERLARRPEGARLFVALPSHRRIWINDVAFYFEAGALPATRHHELYALVATTRSVQEEIVRDLEKWKPPLVVVSTPKVADEPNASSVTYDVTILDDYLASRYEQDFEDGKYRVLRRRP